MEHSFGGSGCTCGCPVIDRVTNQIEHYMDLLSARQKLVASNIANVDTPGYKTKDIDFQFEFMSLATDGLPTSWKPQAGGQERWQQCQHGP